MEYGLIGAKLGHSYSKIIHEMLCGYHYDLCPLPTEEEARAFLAKRQFKAINVTIPYKKLVMEYCSYIDPRAKAIGAVNTVVNKNGLLYGYNTDYMGFAHLCDAHGVNFAGRTVLILGTGGTHNTTSAVARDKGAAKVLTVSRHPDPEKGELSYAEAVSSGAQIVVNTTPAGMYPNVGVCNLDVAAMPDLEAVVDVVYNPDKTELILRAEEAGVPVAVGGLEMLVAQAVYAAEYFLDRKFEDAPVEIRRITAALRRDMLNIALIGMPSSGKTTLGKLLAKQLGRTFVDLDDAIVKADGRSIPDIFAANRNSPGVYIPKPGNQIAHSRLARTGRADNSSGRSVRDRKADMIQNFSVCIGKVHIIKYNFRGCRNHIRPLFIHDWRIVNGICHIHRSRQHLQQGSHIPSVFQIIEHHKGSDHQNHAIGQ